MSSGIGRITATMRVTGALALLACFLIAHGVQCAAASPYPHGAAPIGHVVVVGMHEMAESPEAASAEVVPQPLAPTHGAGHALAICFAVIAAVVALLLGRRLRQSVAGLAPPAQRCLAIARSSGERWRTHAPPLAILCVSRT
ncbi:MAG: hypothetical protein ACR2JK_05385 [Geodermatophilaceae bacterium]